MEELNKTNWEWHPSHGSLELKLQGGWYDLLKAVHYSLGNKSYCPAGHLSKNACQPLPDEVGLGAIGYIYETSLSAVYPVPALILAREGVGESAETDTKWKVSLAVFF